MIKTCLKHIIKPQVNRVNNVHLITTVVVGSSAELFLAKVTTILTCRGLAVSDTMVLPSAILSLPDLCKANAEGHLDSLLYIEMINDSGHQVSGHVDLQDRVSKKYWKESMDNSKWLVPTLTDLTFHSRG